jgi:hypothetical protein
MVEFAVLRVALGYINHPTANPASKWGGIAKLSLTLLNEVILT